MAYTKNTWQSGDVVTSAKLNNIENGIAGVDGMNVLITVDETMSLQIKAGDLFALAQAGTLVRFVVNTDGIVSMGILYDTNHSNEYYEFSFRMIGKQVDFYAATADDYPVFDAPSG